MNDGHCSYYGKPTSTEFNLKVARRPTQGSKSNAQTTLCRMTSLSVILAVLIAYSPHFWNTGANSIMPAARNRLKQSKNLHHRYSNPEILSMTGLSQINSEAKVME
jgi:hypothetical protein